MKILRDAGDQEVLPNDNFMASTDNYPLGPTKPRGGNYPASYPNQTILHRFSEFEQEFVKLRHHRRGGNRLASHRNGPNDPGAQGQCGQLYSEIREQRLMAYPPRPFPVAFTQTAVSSGRDSKEQGAGWCTCMRQLPRQPSHSSPSW